MLGWVKKVSRSLVHIEICDPLFYVLLSVGALWVNGFCTGLVYCVKLGGKAWIEAILEVRHDTLITRMYHKIWFSFKYRLNDRALFFPMI